MKKSKKYRVIAKVGDEHFVKYRVNDLVKFTSFLDQMWPTWRWFNVHEYREGENGPQIANFTAKNRPTSRFV